METSGVCSPEEGAHGTARTGADGSFEVGLPPNRIPGFERKTNTLSATPYADVVDATEIELRTVETM